MPGRGTTVVMFNRCQIQEKSLAANKLLYFLLFAASSKRCYLVGDAQAGNG